MIYHLRLSTRAANRKGIVYALYGAGNLQRGEIYLYQLLRAVRSVLALGTGT